MAWDMWLFGIIGVLFLIANAWAMSECLRESDEDRHPQGPSHAEVETIRVVCCHRLAPDSMELWEHPAPDGGAPCELPHFQHLDFDDRDGPWVHKLEGSWIYTPCMA